MAQYLWNAGVLMAEIVGGGGSLDGGGVEEGEGGGSGSALDDGNAGEISLVGMTRKRHEDNWNVSGEKVLELGAGERNSHPRSFFFVGGVGRKGGKGGLVNHLR